MKRIAIGALGLLLLAIITATGFTWKSNMSAGDKQMNVKSLPQHGLTVIAPSDPRFDIEVASMLKQDELKPFIEAAQPFCVFVRNESSQEVVGCSLKWDLLAKDGEVFSIPQAYIALGALMGEEPIDPAMIGHTSLINPHSVIFISLDPAVKQIIDAEIHRRPGMPGPSAEARQETQNYIADMQTRYENQLKTISSITVSIDGIFFKDGAFVGADTTQFFTSVQAQVNAKRDLVQSVEQGIKEGKSITEMFDQTESVSREQDGELNPDASPTELYNQIYSRTKHIFAQELLRIKRSKGDEAAIGHARRSLTKPWPKLRKIDE